MGANKFIELKSGQRDSNARHQPWQGCALPLSYARNYLVHIVFDFIINKLHYLIIYVKSFY